MIPTNSSSTQSKVFYYTTPTTATNNNNNPSPLELTYHSPSTRHLSTLLPTATTTTPSIITEIDSAYCPQSFASWDANSAFHSANGGVVVVDSSKENNDDANHVPQLGSLSCPICQSVLALTIQESKLYPSLLFSSSSSQTPPPSTSSLEGKEQQYTHVCMYKCGYCQWNSIDELKIGSKMNLVVGSDDGNEDGITTTTTTTTTKNEKELVEMATNEVQTQMAKAMEKRKQTTMSSMNTIIDKWKEIYKLEEVNKRKTEMLLTKPTIGSTTIANTCTILNTKDLNSASSIATTTGGKITSLSSSSSSPFWSMEELNHSILQKRDYMNHQIKDSILSTYPPKDKEEKDANAPTILQRLSISDVSSSTLSSSSSLLADHIPNSSSIPTTRRQCFRPLNQLTLSATNAPEEQSLMPTPVQLRTRAIKRDYQELSLGKPGILVKPKVNPLEGDSSLRYGQGQWWKKVMNSLLTRM